MARALFARRRKLGWTVRLLGIGKGEREKTKRQHARNTSSSMRRGADLTIDDDLEKGSWLDYACSCRGDARRARFGSTPAAGGDRSRTSRPQALSLERAKWWSAACRSATRAATRWRTPSSPSAKAVAGFARFSGFAG